MKILLKRIICAMLSCLLLFSFVACNDTSEPIAEITDTDSETTELPVTEITGNDGETLRVLITSDVHHTGLQLWYGIGSNTRMQWWVNAINKEHQEEPFDLIIIAGDTSLDHLADRGTYTTQKLSTTDDFVKRFVSQLPEGVPVYILPGNHEQYNNAQWKEMTGNDRQFTVELKGNLFICLDNYNDNLEPYRNGDPSYTPTDTDYVKEQLQKYPDCKNVWLVAHMFEPAKETEEFKSIVKNEDRIKGLFAGHTHKCDVKKLDSSWGGKKIAETGNYSYTYYTAYPPSDPTEFITKVQDSFWGFRELRISDEAAISNYIIAETKGPLVNGKAIDLKRKIVNSVRFY